MITYWFSEFSSYSLELEDIRKAELSSDIFQKVLHIIKLNIAEEVKQKVIHRHETRINNIIIIFLQIPIYPSLYPIHLHTLSLENLHLQFLMLDFYFLEGN